MTNNRVFDRFQSTLPDDVHLSVSCRMDFDTDSDNPDLTRWFFKLEGSRVTEDSDYADQFTVAEVTLALVDIEMWDHERAFAAYDNDSAELAKVAEATIPQWEEATRLIIVESTKVEAPYRGHGLGPMLAVQALTTLCANKTQSLTMLEAGSFEWDTLTPAQAKKAVAATARSWKRAGFKKVKNASGGSFHTLFWTDVSVEETEDRILAHLSKKSKVASA